MKKYLLTIPLVTLAFGASAHTVLFSENFDGDWTVNFPTVLELDHLPPAANINPMFMNSDGVSMPWWPGKDSNSATDRFMMSHSIYQTPGQSNDWLCSRPIEVTGKGFTLTFEAQSAPMRDVNNLCDLWLFITETPVESSNLPTEPTMHLEKVPYGESLNDVENDFIEYSLDLDPWAGKTIYLNFANLNDNKDILCINNVLVRRLDNIGIEAESPEYVLAGTYDVTGKLEGTLDGGIDNWTLTFEAPDSETQTMQGKRINAGETVDFKFTANVEADMVSTWKLTLTGDDTEPVIMKGNTTGVLFVPKHRVLFEESTGTWCGNCPYGIYTIECMLADDEMKDMVIPVSVHITGGTEDHMVNTAYSAQLGLTAAPMARVDRQGSIAAFSGYDTSFDKNNEQTVGNRIYKRAQKLTFADIELDARFNIVGTDTVSIDCDVRVMPNLTLTDPHAVGFILTENNVGLDGNRDWRQTNYFDTMGDRIPSGMNGWCKLPHDVSGVRFQDVARGIWNFNGINNSMPKTLVCGETHRFSYNIPIPDTFEEREIKGKKTVVSPAIKAANLSVVAFLVNQESCEIVNAVSVPMSEQAEDRFTTADLVKQLSGVEAIAAARNGDAEYYNLQGIKVSNPVAGEVYIELKDGKSRKVIF